MKHQMEIRELNGNLRLWGFIRFKVCWILTGKGGMKRKLTHQGVGLAQKEKEVANYYLGGLL